ncbi:unnamed protein product [Schistosoma curassoni]|uniref:Uncharacterized protein n=1 Tax=Schistosoma curassoni TaxID=6186 RepID=A0A183KR41_9TREM|nr:unnamed protein product [Schistosoma curassoni]
MFHMNPMGIIKMIIIVYSVVLSFFPQIDHRVYHFPLIFANNSVEGELGIVNDEGDETESNFHVEFDPPICPTDENQENQSPDEQSVLNERITNSRSQLPTGVGVNGSGDGRSARSNPRHTRRSLTISERLRAKGSSGITSSVAGVAARSNNNVQNGIDDVRAAQTMYLRRRQVSFEDTLSHLPVSLDTVSHL